MLFVFIFFSKFKNNFFSYSYYPRILITRVIIELDGWNFLCIAFEGTTPTAKIDTIKINNRGSFYSFFFF